MGFGYYTSWGPPKGADEEKSAPDLSAIAHRRWGDLDSFGALKVAASPLKTPFSWEGPLLFEGAHGGPGPGQCGFPPVGVLGT